MGSIFDLPEGMTDSDIPMVPVDPPIEKSEAVAIIDGICRLVEISRREGSTESLREMADMILVSAGLMLASILTEEQLDELSGDLDGMMYAAQAAARFSPN